MSRPWRARLGNTDVVCLLRRACALRLLTNKYVLGAQGPYTGDSINLFKLL